MRGRATTLEQRQSSILDRQQAARPAATPAVSVPGFAERHFAVEELANLWSVSSDTVRRLFEGEPGVLVLASTRGLGHKRRYRTLRIPESVAARVYHRMLNPIGPTIDTGRRMQASPA
jgi:hypothetical protein